MEVILVEDVPHLGRAGEVVKVKDGYARNYLIPKGLAQAATKENLKALEERRRQLERRSTRELERARELAARIGEITCTIRRPAGAEGKLFGAVTSADIEEALKEMGIEVDRKRIELPEPIKVTGAYTVPIKLHPEVTATLKLWVEKEE